MAVSDAYVFPGFLTPVLTQRFFQKPPTTFLTCFCRGERPKYAKKSSRLNWGSNSQPPGHEFDTLTTEPSGWGKWPKQQDSYLRHVTEAQRKEIWKWKGGSRGPPFWERFSSFGGRATLKGGTIYTQYPCAFSFFNQSASLHILDFLIWAAWITRPLSTVKKIGNLSKIGTRGPWAPLSLHRPDFSVTLKRSS